MDCDSSDESTDTEASEQPTHAPAVHPKLEQSTHAPVVQPKLEQPTHASVVQPKLEKPKPEPFIQPKIEYQNYEPVEPKLEYVDFKDPDTPFICQECGSVLKNRSIFGNHVYRSHFSIRKQLMLPFAKPSSNIVKIKCPMWNSLAKDRKNFRYHIRKKHVEISEDPLLTRECLDCQVYFRTGIEWEQHALKFHGVTSKSLMYDIQEAPKHSTDPIAIYGSPVILAKVNGKYGWNYCNTTGPRV